MAEQEGAEDEIVITIMHKAIRLINEGRRSAALSAFSTLRG